MNSLSREDGTLTFVWSGLRGKGRKERGKWWEGGRNDRTGLLYVHICILIVTKKVLIGVHTHLTPHTYTDTQHTTHTPHTTPHLTPTHTHTHTSHRAHSKLSSQVEWKRIQFRAFHRRGSVEIESGTSVDSR